jgi:ketosteroid isomerase-like protein
VTSSLTSGNAALELTWTGTQSGPPATAKGTISPLGKHQETPAVISFTFEGGKIEESRQYFDVMALLTQIGARCRSRIALIEVDRQVT